MEDDKLYHEIEAYLGGEMSPEEALDFEKKMQGNKDLRQEVSLYDQLNHCLANRLPIGDIPTNEYTDKLKEFIESEEAETLKEKLKELGKSHKKPINFFSKYKYSIYAGAALVLVFLLLRIIAPSSNEDLEDLFISSYDPDDLPAVVTRENSENEFYDVVTALQNQNYRNALNLFVAYEQSSKNIDTMLYLYKGMAYLQLKEYNNALLNFNLVANSEQLDRSKGLWFKALLFLKLNDKKNAKKVLQEITGNPKNFNFKEAKAILEQLNK